MRLSEAGRGLRGVGSANNEGGVGGGFRGCLGVSPGEEEARRGDGEKALGQGPSGSAHQPENSHRVIYYH